METEYVQEFKDLQRDERLGFFKGVASALALMALCGTVLYGAYRVNRAVQEAMLFIEVSDGK